MVYITGESNRSGGSQAPCGSSVLPARQVPTVLAPGKYNDGGRLWLAVSKTGTTFHHRHQAPVVRWGQEATWV